MWTVRDVLGLVDQLSSGSWIQLSKTLLESCEYNITVLNIVESAEPLVL